jgi:hypothetical protein
VPNVSTPSVIRVKRLIIMCSVHALREDTLSHSEVVGFGNSSMGQRIGT